MFSVSVLKQMRAKYRTMETKDLEDLLDRQKSLLNLFTDIPYLTRTKQKIKMIEDELKSRNIDNTNQI